MGWFSKMKARYLLDQFNNEECNKLLDEAGRHFENQQFEEALRLFIEIIKKKPQDYDILGTATYYSGIIFMGIRDYDSAKLAYDKLREMGGKHKKLANDLMGLIQKAKEYDKNNKSSDKWVFIGSNDSITDYYDSTSVKIIKEEPCCITVTCKRVYTTKGKKMLFDYFGTKSVNKDWIKDVHHSLNSYNIYYKERKKQWLMTTYVSKSGEILEGAGSIMGYDYPRPVPEPIIPGTVDDLILNQLIKDYKINI